MVDNQSSALASLYQEDLYHIPGKVLVVLSKEWSQVTPEEGLTLSKMLAAVKQSLASVQVVTLASFSMENVSAFSPSKILVFGSSLNDFSNRYEHIKVNGTSVVVADAIDKLNDANKKALWLALKSMFEL
jgi:hypothetical protein